MSTYPTGRLLLDQGQIAEARKLAAENRPRRAGLHQSPYDGDHRTRHPAPSGARRRETRDDTPWPNVVVAALGDTLGAGASRPFLTAIIRSGLSPLDVARGIGDGSLTLASFEPVSELRLAEKARELLAPQLARIAGMRNKRNEWLAKEAPRQQPLLYVIVATGNIHEDVIQAAQAAREGADIIAVIRATAQSLLDYVPYGLTTEGFGGTYATQENFALMRAALDEVSEELGRYVRLVNYASGLCMPEIAAMGALERLDLMLNDSMYGILFRDINMHRTFCDQHFARMLNAYAGITINTGEDNYLTTADAVEAACTVLASDLINEQFAKNSGLTPNLMGLGHAYEIRPEIENSFLLELANALLLREVFPEHPLKYMPPTKHMTGDIFRTYLVNGLYNLASQWSGQGIQLLGMLTEAIHTPHLQDRYLAIANAQLVMNAVRDLGSEVTIKPDGFITRRAQSVLAETLAFLQEVRATGLMTSIAAGRFADIKRSPDGGKGLSGVAPKSADYYNPMLDVFREQLDAKVD